jgi:hypothetical protein
MSLPVIIAINIGAAMLLSMVLAALMLLPKRFRPHHLPHLHADRAERPTAAATSRHGAPARRQTAGQPRIVTDP